MLVPREVLLKSPRDASESQGDGKDMPESCAVRALKPRSLTCKLRGTRRNGLTGASRGLHDLPAPTSFINTTKIGFIAKLANVLQEQRQLSIRWVADKRFDVGGTSTP
jgi:hypothetical protein